MCIIAAKPAGAKLPNKNTRRAMWDSNPHGAGIMYAHGGTVYIHKGYRTYREFENALKRIGSCVDLEAVPVVLHFRVATHGGICAENTHPFPVSRVLEDLQALDGTARVAIAHNGIIPCVRPRGPVSDTMEYIMTRVADIQDRVPDWYTRAEIREAIRREIQSKFAVLAGTGDLATIGDFLPYNGVLYSNATFREPRW